MAEIRPVSEVYNVAAPLGLVDVPVDDHYRGWGYALAEILGADGSPTPEGGNTVIFRLFPGYMTEPVFVTKPQSEATFTVSVISGRGKLIRANAAGEVEYSDMLPGLQIVIKPGDAYSYYNDSGEDLLLHDTAYPAFKEGDDAQLYLMPLRALGRGQDCTNYEITDSSGAQRAASIPDRFTELVAFAMRSPDA